jgi:TorA maturation chaperone TorD
MPTPSEFSIKSPAAAVSDDGGRVDELLATAVLCRALKIGFDRPDIETQGTFFTTEGVQTLHRAAEQLVGDTTDRVPECVSRIASLHPRGVEDLQPVYDRLFGHTLRSQVCPYECEYGKPGVFRQAQELADLGGFYAAFSLQTRAAKHQRHDHIACELEFLQFLCHKELWAIENEDREMQEVTAEAARRFLKQHLARFGPAFAAGLRNADPEGFYGELGALLHSFLMALCRRRCWSRSRRDH